MANKWGGNIIELDTASTDANYDKTHDALESGSNIQYSTMRYKIKKIQVMGANGEQVKLLQCTPNNIHGSPIVDMVLETGALNQQVDFGSGMWFKGINPDVIGANSKALVYLA